MTSLDQIYAAQGGVTTVFSAKVNDYVLSRPDYPQELLDALREHCGLIAGDVVADVGSGTGLLTYSLLQRGYKVLAVEPNTPMREAAEVLLKEFQHYQSVAGTGEETTLPDETVKLITIAQAFHWLDVNCARREFLRILRPDGNVALIWNDRVLTDPIHIALDTVFSEFGGAKRQALVAQERERENVSRFFADSEVEEWHFPHLHWLDEAALLSLVFSRSYMPARESVDGANAAHAVAALFDTHQQGGAISVRYQTVAFVGRPR